MMLAVRSERNEHPHSDSTNCLVANLFSSDAQEIANPETGNISIQVFGNDEHRSFEVRSDSDMCSAVQQKSRMILMVTSETTQKRVVRVQAKTAI